MLVVLPVSVGSVVDFCAKGEARYSATIGVRVVDCQNHLWRVEATDGRFCGVVQGENEIPDKLEAIHLSASDAPDPELVNDAVVPAKEWKAIFAGKDGDRVAVWSDGKSVILRRFDSKFPVQVIKQMHMLGVEGRFPPVNNVMPARGPTIELVVDAQLLGKALAAAADILANGYGKASVVLGFYAVDGNGTLIGISGKRSDEPAIVFDGLVVPLAPTKPSNGQHVPKPNGAPPNTEPQASTN
jgi:hypothetical protein